MGCDSGSVVRRLVFSWVLLLDSDGTLLASSRTIVLYAFRLMFWFDGYV